MRPLKIQLIRCSPDDRPRGITRQEAINNYDSLPALKKPNQFEALRPAVDHFNVRQGVEQLEAPCDMDAYPLIGEEDVPHAEDEGGRHGSEQPE